MHITRLGCVWGFFGRFLLVFSLAWMCRYVRKCSNNTTLKFIFQGFLVSCPTSLSSPRLTHTSLVVLTFAPLHTLEARKAAERSFPSGQPRLTITALKYVRCGTGCWETSLVGMFSPTSLVWSVNNQFISSLHIAFNVNVYLGALLKSNRHLSNSI